MEQYKFSETKKVNDHDVTFTWHPNKILDDVPAAQVYLFCVLPDKTVVLVRDSGETRFTPVGGGLETNEKPEDGARREAQEEAQLELGDLKLLGALEVLDPSNEDAIQKHHQQIRFVTHLDKLPEFVPNKDGWEVEERITVSVDELPKFVSWIKYPSGEVQYRMLLDYLDKKIEL